MRALLDQGRQEEPLKRLLWHPAGFSALELRVWSLLASDPRLRVSQMALILRVHQDSVGRALRRLRRAGLLEPADQERLHPRGTFGGTLRRVREPGPRA